MGLEASADFAAEQEITEMDGLNGSSSFDADRPLAATHIDFVRGIMLFPDDSKLRETFLAKLIVSRKRAHAQGEPEVKAPLGLLEALSERSQLDMNKRIHQAFILGEAAGNVALRMFGLEMFRGGLSTEGLKTTPEHLKFVIGQVCEGCQPRRTPSWFNNKVWPTYKRVCHLWAASLVETRDTKNVFPCAVGNLPRFLALASVIEEFCTTHHLPRQVGPWVAKSDIWAIPPVNKDSTLIAAAQQKFEEYSAFLATVIQAP